MRTVLLSLVTILPLTAFASAAETPKPTTTSGPTEINGKTLKEWVAELEVRKTPDPGFRQRAIQAIALFPPETASKEATAALLNSVSDHDASIRVNALIALALIGVSKDYHKQALPILVKQLNEDPQGIVRLHAAVVLGDMNSAARDAIPALANRCKDTTSYEIRKMCVMALARAGQADDAAKTPPDMRAVQTLAGVAAGLYGGYADRSAEVRLAAVTSMGQMGTPPLPADKAVVLNTMNAALKDPQKVIQIWARVSLMRLEGVKDEHLLAIVQYLKSDDALAKVEAIKAVGAVGQDAIKVCFPHVVELLNDPDPGFIASAAMTLGEWGDNADKALPQLQKLYDAKSTDERLKPLLKETIDKVMGKKKP